MSRNIIPPEGYLEMSIKALTAYNIEPNIIKSMLNNLEEIVAEKKALLADLMNEQQEVINSPIRFNGVRVEKIKQVFEKYGVKSDVGF